MKRGAHKCRGHDTVIIRYAQCQKKNKMRLCHVKIQGEDDQLCRWLAVLREALEKVSRKRPKRYLVFVNPFSGRQNGVDLYTRKVKPILEVAGVETCVIVTKNEGDYEKVICSGVDCYDAILAVGGDGTVSKIVNCLISSQMDASLTGTEEGDAAVPKIKLPIAIIPCGSTDCIAFTLNGTRDTETCALYAVLGDLLRYDVCRTVSDTGSTKFFLSVFTYGFLSDLLRESEKFRWMGPIRYNYAGLLTLLRSKEYYGQLDLIGEECKKKCPSSENFKSKTLPKRRASMFIIPFVPTVEPVPECLDLQITCSTTGARRARKIPACERRKVCGCNEEVMDEEEPAVTKCVGEVFAEKERCGEVTPNNEETPKEFGDEEQKKVDGTEEYVPVTVCEGDPVRAGEKDEGCWGEEPAGPVIPEAPSKGESIGDGLPAQGSCHDIVPQKESRNVVPLHKELVRNQEEGERICIRGKYFLIACTNISCSSELAPNGLAPECVPGDGQMRVVLFQPSSIWDLYKIYSRLTSKEKGVFLSDLPFVTMYKTNRVKISVQENEGCGNCANLDGELFEGSVVDIKVLEGVIRFFARTKDDDNVDGLLPRVSPSGHQLTLYPYSTYY